jgi:hypothetical protein
MTYQKIVAVFMLARAASTTISLEGPYWIYILNLPLIYMLFCFFARLQEQIRIVFSSRSSKRRADKP